jgi:hypothetical protein
VVNPAETRTFTWTCVAAGPGTVSFSASAVGWESVSGTPLPVFAISNTVLIQSVPILSANLSFTGGSLKAFRTIEITLQIDNAGSASAFIVAPPLQISPNGWTLTVAGPSPQSGTLLSGSSLTFLYRLTLPEAGTLSVTAPFLAAPLSSTTAAFSAAPPAPLILTVEPRPEGSIAVFPNPVRVGANTVSVYLRLAGDTRAVTVDAYDASMHRVWSGRWKNVWRMDDPMNIVGLADWAPGVYLIRARAEYESGESESFPVAKLVVKP